MSAGQVDVVFCASCGRSIALGSIPLGQSILRHADRVLLEHRKHCTEDRQEVAEAAGYVTAWLDDDEMMRVPDNEWGREFYRAVETLVKAVR